MLHLVLSLYIMAFSPVDSVALDRECNTLIIYDNEIYCAPFVGNNIYLLDSMGSVKALPFTDNNNYRIRNFCVTPFVIFVNNGITIEKYYRAQGITQSIFSAKDISSFSLTEFEEIILADYQNRQLIYLDFNYEINITHDDVQVKDIFIEGDSVYVLVHNKILVFDEHANIILQYTVPAGYEKIRLINNQIVVFSPGALHINILRKEWHKIHFPYGILDIACNQQIVVLLSNNGLTLYYYQPTDF